MTALAIKQKLIRQIQSTRNIGILREVYRLLEIDGTDMDILKLPEPQRKKIIRAKKDIQLGRVISNEQANSEIDQWLNE